MDQSSILVNFGILEIENPSIERCIKQLVKALILSKELQSSHTAITILQLNHNTQITFLNKPVALGFSANQITTLLTDNKHRQPQMTAEGAYWIIVISNLFRLLICPRVCNWDVWPRFDTALWNVLEITNVIAIVHDFCNLSCLAVSGTDIRWPTDNTIGYNTLSYTWYHFFNIIFVQIRNNVVD